MPAYPVVAEVTVVRRHQTIVVRHARSRLHGDRCAVRVEQRSRTRAADRVSLEDLRPGAEDSDEGRRAGRRTPNGRRGRRDR